MSNSFFSSGTSRPSAAAAAPGLAADTGREFHQVERFGQVVVRALLQSEDLVLDRVFGREDDHVFAATLCLEIFEQVQTVAVGQHDVQQDAVVLVGAQFFFRLGVRAGRFYHVAFAGEGALHQFAQRRFVFYNEDFHTEGLGFRRQKYREILKRNGNEALFSGRWDEK